MAETTAKQTATVLDEIGLHVRPAEMIVRVAKPFVSDVHLVYEEQKVDAKSIMHILTLGARHGAEVEVRASGDDAPEAVAAIVDLFVRNFDADSGATGAPAQDTFPQGGAAPGGTLGQQA